MSSGAVLKEGWATKCGGFWKTWHRRWFVLTGNILEYSKQPGVTPQGSINLNETGTISYAPDCKKQPALQIVCPDRTYYMVPDTPQEVDDWIDALNKAKQSEKKSRTTTTPDDYAIIRYVYHGLHSSILEVRDTLTNRTYIAKRYSTEGLGNQTDELDRYRRELMGKKIPYVCPLVDVVQDENCIMFISEPRPSSLDQVLKAKPTTPVLADSIFTEILEGLRSLHQLGFIYGDFHISNVLIDYQGHVSLSIPGFVLKPNPNQERYLSYLSPQILNDEKPSSRSDMWAACIMLFYIYTGYVPYVSSTIPSLKEEQKQSIKYPSLIPSETQKRLKSWLDPDSREELKVGTDMHLPNYEAPTLLVDLIPKPSEAKKSVENIDVSHEALIISFSSGSAILENL